MIYAKEIFNNREDKDRLRKAFFIFESLIKRDMTNNNHATSLEGIVYHMLGQLFWENYNESKGKHYDVSDLNKGSFENWKTSEIDDIVDYTISGNNDTKKFSVVKCLEKAKNSYENAKEMKEKNNEDVDETLGNLAIVLLELAKLMWKKENNEEEKSKIKKYLKDAESHLKYVKNTKPTFNTFWDLARLYHYKLIFIKNDIDQERTTEEIKENLKRIFDTIKPDNVYYFRKEIEKDWIETQFPGDKDTFANINDKLDKMIKIK